MADMTWDEQRIRYYSTRGLMPDGTQYPGGSLCALQRTIAEVDRLLSCVEAYRERMDRDSDGYLKSLGEIAEIQAETNQLSRDLENENAELKAEMMAEQAKRNLALLDGGNPDDTVLPQTRADLERERDELVKAAELVIAWDDDDEAISGTLDFEPLREALKLAKARKSK